MDKARLIAQIVEALEAQLEALAASARAAKAGATDQEAKPENQYDTRALEASYLAGAQAARADQIRAEITQLRLLHLRDFKKGEPADAGALCELVDEDDARALYFLAPGRGMALGTGKQKVQVITPLSPLGRELLGKREGDDLEVELRGAVRSYTVRSVR